MEQTRSAQKSLDEKEAAMERLKRWKEEEAERKRVIAEQEVCFVDLAFALSLSSGVNSFRQFPGCCCDEVFL
jgi:hypothetical protein